MSTEPPMTPAEFRQMAESLRKFAEQYAELAHRMESGNIDSVEESGRTMFQNAVSKNLRRNIHRLTGRLNNIDAMSKPQIPIQQQIVAAETKQQYVAETKPKKRSPKGKAADK